jgi:hypothetical protein
MLQCLYCCRAQLRVNLKHPKVEVNKMLTNSCLQIEFHCRYIAFTVFLQQVTPVRGPEQVTTGYQVEEHRSQAENVTLCPIWLALEYFWGNIARGAAFFCQQSVSSVSQYCSESEISNLNIILTFRNLVDQNIFQFDIPMSYIFLVHKI